MRLSIYSQSIKSSHATISLQSSYSQSIKSRLYMRQSIYRQATVNQESRATVSLQSSYSQSIKSCIYMRQSTYSQAIVNESRVAYICDSQFTFKLQSVNQESHIYATVNQQSSYSRSIKSRMRRECSECSRQQITASYKSDQSSNQSVLLSDAGCVSVYG